VLCNSKNFVDVSIAAIEHSFQVSKIIGCCTGSLQLLSMNEHTEIINTNFIYHLPTGHFAVFKEVLNGIMQLHFTQT
jgi:hypothetical protein